MISWRRWYAKLWNDVQDAAIGYGNRPTRAFLLLLVLFTAGVVVSGMSPRRIRPPAGTTPSR